MRDKRFFEKNGVKCTVVDIDEVNASDKANFFVSGGFIREKNDNSSTDMPLGLNDVNLFLLTMPINTKLVKKKEWIRAWQVWKKNNGTPNYDWNSAKRIVSELTGFFQTWPKLGVEVLRLGNMVWLKKTKHVWLKCAAQTSLKEVLA